jgi:hypothetical protein
MRLGLRSTEWIHGRGELVLPPGVPHSNAQGGRSPSGHGRRTFLLLAGGALDILWADYKDTPDSTYIEIAATFAVIALAMESALFAATSVFSHPVSADRKGARSRRS